MMILIAINTKGIIKSGMKFVFLRETEFYYECWSVDLELTFKISKQNISNNFKIKYYD